MVQLADTIALGAIGETLGGSNPLPPILKKMSGEVIKADTAAVIQR